MKKRKKRGGLYAVLLLVAVLGGTGYLATEKGWFRAEEEVAIEGAEARRGDLLISETVRGNL